ncbi:glycosyltransferase family 39 protein [Myxococcus faecalis]|uniref:glycosyltransferase family 39 protein n=1 Tax=Myxococcus faecalis TaxID=3115646 RepID=UPI003CF4E968
MNMRQRVGLLVCGATLYACFFGLSQTAPGLSITFHPPWTNASPAEAYVWLGALLLLTPGACLLGVALSPWLVQGIQALSRRVTRMSSRERRAGAVMLACLFVGIARAGHAFFLRGFPFTDDEWAARFGGQVLAAGVSAMPRPAPFIAFPDLFLYAHDGRWAGLDWLGVQLAWAVAELSGLGDAVFAVAAALALLGVIAVGARRHGATGGLLAGALLVASPMMGLLSFTTHAHVLSRGMLAIALWAFVVATERRTLGAWFWTGLALGVAGMTRPFEVCALVLPLAVAELVASAKRGEFARTLSGVALGLALPFIATFAHALVVTGGLLPPRLAANNEVVHPYLAHFKGTFSLSQLGERFGANFSYNLVMLALWFLGPVGLVLVGAAFGKDRFSRLLGWGVVVSLLVALIHDDHGLHLVGPIHYSESVVPLSLLATTGLLRLLEVLRARGLPTEAMVGALAMFLVLALGTFTVWNGLALRRQAEIHEYVYGVVDEPDLSEAVVLAPAYSNAWNAIPRFRTQGSFVFSWRRPRPDLSDSVLVLLDAPGEEPRLRALLPGRRFFRLSRTKEGQLELVALPGA